MSTDYDTFLRSKVRLAESWGFEASESEVNQALMPHQRATVLWAVAGGRRAIFAAFGLGKSVVQLETVRLTLAKLLSRDGRRGRGLIVCPPLAAALVSANVPELAAWQGGERKGAA